MSARVPARPLLRRAVHREVLAHLGADPEPGFVRRQVVQAVRSKVPALPLAEQVSLVDACLDDIVGLGELESILRDPEHTEVMYNGAGALFVERAGVLTRVACDLDDEAISRITQRIIAPLGLRLDRTAPIVDARLADGARVHAIVPPLAIDGPCLTIRRFPRVAHTLDDFAMDASARDLCTELVAQRWNVLVVGGTSSGKTTLLNALGRHIPAGERVVTIEDTAELALGHPHVVRLEARRANAEGIGAVTIRDLVRTALRMRPDRIVVGEVRGGEALDMLQACNTGHDGSLSTLHANSVTDALSRLDVLVLMARSGLPHDAIRSQIVSGIDAIIHVGRGRDGVRRILEVAEVGAVGDSTPTRSLALAHGSICRIVAEPRRRTHRIAT